MNCKQGDLAVIVGTTTENAHKLVEVIEPFTERQFIGFSTRGGIWTGPIWWVRAMGSPIVGPGGERFTEYPAPDSKLSPLRGNEGDDEMLRIAGRPRELVSG